MLAVPLSKHDKRAREDLKQGLALRLFQARESLGIRRIEWIKKYQVIPSRLSQWETGQCMPDMAILSRICQDHDISLDYLFFGRKPTYRVAAPTKTPEEIQPI